MKNSIVSAFVFFYLLIVSVRSDFLTDTCREVANNDPDISFNLCVSVLQKNPKARSATSVADLTKVAIDTAISDAKSMESVISKLLSDKSLEQYVRSCLEDCSELYSDAGSDLNRGKQAFEGKDYGTANTAVSAAMDDSGTCEDQFKDKTGVMSPLTRENLGFFQLTGTTLALINMVQK